jgi:hypothetical protein
MFAASAWDSIDRIAHGKVLHKGATARNRLCNLNKLKTHRKAQKDERKTFDQQPP